MNPSTAALQSGPLSAIHRLLQSRLSVIGLNILQCAVFVYAFLFLAPRDPGQSSVGYLAPFVPPALTLLFFLARAPGVALAAVAVIINSIAMLVGFGLLYMLSEFLTPGVVLIVGTCGMLVPAISLLGVATRWPRAGR